MSRYDAAIEALYQAPFAEFVERRKKLALELKTHGDKEASARLAKLPRPPVSAWAVNQLWWKERATFEALISAASRVKRGEREAMQTHRELAQRLRDRAAQLLRDEGNAASEATLRRVTTTLAAVAASAGFAPEPEGALSADRDPPGFEALGAFGTAPSIADRGLRSPPPEDGGSRDRAERAAEARRQAQEERARRQRDEEERTRREAERQRLTVALANAHELCRAQEREVAQRREALDEAEHGLRETRSLIEELAAKLSHAGEPAPRA